MKFMPLFSKFVCISVCVIIVMCLCPPCTSGTAAATVMASNLQKGSPINSTWWQSSCQQWNVNWCKVYYKETGRLNCSNSQPTGANFNTENEIKFWLQ